MMEKLQEYMKRKFDYDIAEYAYFEVPYKKSVFVPIGLGLFGVTAILFLLDLILSWDRIGFLILVLAFVLFVLVPLATKKGNKYDAIIVTPEYLIQRTSRTEFVAVNFDNVSSFKLTERGIFIKGKHHTVVLGLTMFRDEIDPIIDILEAKGKTFDPDKEYMIRPVHIHIKDNQITLEDIHEVSEFDLLYQQCAPDYAMLTPGFIETIIFRNSSVTNCCGLQETNLAFSFDRLEVKEGHPENTKFESVIAQDCIVIFHKAKIKTAILKNTHDPNEADQDLGTSVENLKEPLQDAVVSEWKIGKSSIDFIFASGVHSLALKLNYQNVIIGWNKLKE